MKLKKIKLVKKDLNVKDKIFTIDVTRLQQVLINLITNAIKYSPEGAKIEISAKAEKIDLLGSCVVFISVSDEGIGISEEN